MNEEIRGQHSSGELDNGDQDLQESRLRIIKNTKKDQVSYNGIYMYLKMNGFAFSYFFFILFCQVKLFFAIEISHILILFPDYRRQRRKRPEVKEYEEKLEESSMTG